MNLENSSVVRLDPLPSDWLDDSRINYIQQIISPLSDLLIKTGVLDSVLGTWIDDQILTEVLSNKNVFEDLNSELNLVNSEIFCSADPLNMDLISKNDFLIAWSALHWSNKLESMYLRNKEKLDSVSFRLITLSNKNLATELYHRLKANEDSFDALSMRYAEGKERFRGGYYPLQSLDSLPDSLKIKLRSSKSGDLLKPFQSGDNSYSILLVGDLTEATFDNRSKKILLELQLKEWKSTILPCIQDLLVEY